MAINRTSPKKGKVVDIPDATITIGTPTAGSGQVSVAFTVASTPATGGPVQKYTAISSPGSFTADATTSPVVVTGLTNGTAYTIQVAAANATGRGALSSASASATPAIQTSYESISTVTVGSGGSSTISFSSIPSTYKHLQLRGTIRGSRVSTNDILGVQFNSDTSSSNYVSHRLIGDGSSAASSSTNSGAYSLNWVSDFPATTATANVFGVFVLDLLDYATSNKNRVGRTLSGYDANGSGSSWLTSQLWINTSSISSITFLPVFGTGFAQYSQIGLYGIKG